MTNPHTRDQVVLPSRKRPSDMSKIILRSFLVAYKTYCTDNSNYQSIELNFFLSAPKSWCMEKRNEKNHLHTSVKITLSQQLPSNNWQIQGVENRRQVLQVHDTRYFVFCLSELLTLQVLDKHLLSDQRDFATLKTIQPAVFHFCVTNRKSSSGLARNSHVFFACQRSTIDIRKSMHDCNLGKLVT